MDGAIGVIGCGYWGKNLVRIFAQLRALGCICDQDAAALSRQKALYPGIRTTDRFEDMLESNDISAVVIASPAAQHYDMAKAAILCGKDVFVEKPLALQYAEGEELVELAAARNSILMVGHILEYHPAVAVLRDLLQRGELGKMLYIYSNRLNLGRVRQVENILWSLAPHDIAIICRLVGSAPKAVSCFGGSYLQTGVVDVTVANMQFNGDVRAHIFVNWLHPFKEQKLVVVGDRKMAVFDDTVKEGKLKIYDKGIELRSGQLLPRQTSETTLFLDETEPLLIECEHFLSCLQNREPPLTDGTSALRVLQVLQACQLSLERSGSVVDLGEIHQKTSTVKAS